MQSTCQSLSRDQCRRQDLRCSLPETSPAKLHVVLQLPKFIREDCLVSHRDNFTRPLEVRGSNEFGVMEIIA